MILMYMCICTRTLSKQLQYAWYLLCKSQTVNYSYTCLCKVLSHCWLRNGPSSYMNIGIHQILLHNCGIQLLPTVSWQYLWLELPNSVQSSLIPRLLGTQNVHVWRAWYLFSRDHDVIKIRPEFLEQKGDVLPVIQPTLHSTLSVYDIHSPAARYL